MKFKLLLSSLVAVFLTLGVILPTYTQAASLSSLLVNVVPENPNPEENVSITLNSYASDLDSVNISWFQNGKRIISGIGQKSFSLNAPKAGNETTVTVVVALPEGELNKKIIIRPASMTLLWQANDSYVPPFYKGKALPTPDSEIKVVALPEIKTGSKTENPKNLVYAWTQDYSNMQNASGYGKNSFVYVSDYLETSSNVSVLASTTSQASSSQASIDIGIYQPKILFYKNDVNLGTDWGQALSSPHTIENNEVIEAAPYFISPKNLDIPNLVWNWFINDSLVNIRGSRQNLISLEAQSGISGVAKIKLELRNKYKIFGDTSKEINVEF